MVNARRQRSIPAQGFPRRSRLTRPRDFVKALKQKTLVRNPRFALYVFEPEPELEPATDEEKGPGAAERDIRDIRGRWRLGLVVPKRHEASAVRRNAIKRVWREAFRRQPDLPNLPGRGLVARLLGSIATEQSLALLKRQCHEDAELLLQQMIVKLQAQNHHAV